MKRTYRFTADVTVSRKLKRGEELEIIMTRPANRGDDFPKFSTTKTSTKELKP